jgi:DNA gyrase subunit A
MEGDSLVDVRLTNGRNELIIASRKGRAVRFDENDVRTIGRDAIGVRGIRLADENDEAVGMIVVNNPLEESVLVVSEKGYGKRTPIDTVNAEGETENIYRITSRGGKGVLTLNVTEKTGNLVAIKNVSDEHDLMIINKSGIAIRLSVKECRLQGSNTQGVRLIHLEKKNDIIASVCKVMGAELEARVEQESRAQWATKTTDTNPSNDGEQQVEEQPMADNASFTPMIELADDEPMA